MSLKRDRQAKYMAKQERVAKRKRQVEDQSSWFKKNAHFCSEVTVDDVLRIKNKNIENNKVVSYMEQCLRQYFDLQDRDSFRVDDDDSNSEHSKYFIAEGTETVRLLLQQCASIQISSIFLKPTLLFHEPVRLLADIEKTQSTNEDGKETAPFQVLVGADAVLSKVAGFPISRGCLACGVIPTNRTETWLFELLAKSPSTLRILALDGISDTANLGAMIRCASAFGVTAVILSKDCCSAWYRRSVRVSMGHIFRVPCVRVENLSSTLRSLAGAPYNVKSHAAVIDTSATLLKDIKRESISSRWCCVMGNEANGISAAVVEASHLPIRIDMETGVDSLSVPIATGILLNGLRERESDVGCRHDEQSK